MKSHNKGARQIANTENAPSTNIQKRVLMSRCDFIQRYYFFYKNIKNEVIANKTTIHLNRDLSHNLHCVRDHHDDAAEFEDALPQRTRVEVSIGRAEQNFVESRPHDLVLALPPAGAVGAQLRWTFSIALLQRCQSEASLGAAEGALQILAGDRVACIAGACPRGADVDTTTLPPSLCQTGLCIVTRGPSRCRECCRVQKSIKNAH